MQTLQSIFDACVMIYNHPKDWSPSGGLFWLTGLIAVWTVTTVIFTLWERREQALLAERIRK